MTRYNFCGGCRFYDPSKNVEFGTCKRFPPVFSMNEEFRIDGYGDQIKEYVTRQVQPEMKCSDFCGEWQNIS